MDKEDLSTQIMFRKGPYDWRFFKDMVLPNFKHQRYTLIRSPWV